MRRLHKVAVLGSGVMGSAIACHFANAGLEVLLLDILPKAENGEIAAGKRNSVADGHLGKAIKSKPAPLYIKDYAKRITTGNFEDDFPRIADCDWILEAVIERLDIKKTVLEKVDEFRKEGSIVTSNTSGIPIKLMLEGRSDDFRKNFLGTHFFNPPRYLRLLEIIPTKETDPALVEFMMQFGEINLGKETVLCKDTPAFIANRVGVYAMALIFKLTEELGLSIQDVDKLTGPALGRPKTGTFRLADLVGLDTAVKVIEGMQANCPDDEQVQALGMPAFLKHLVDNNFLGNKSGKGFFEATSERDEKGKRVILGLNLKTLEYELPQKTSLPSLTVSKQIDDLGRRVSALVKQEDAGGQLIRKSLGGLFAYVSKRIPEITGSPYAIDQAMKAGFGWDMGPFEYWDAIGIAHGLAIASESGFSVADWAIQLEEKGITTFYRIQNGAQEVYNPESGQYEPIPGGERRVNLDTSRHEQPVFKNDEVVVHDIGDQVLCLEFQSKANAIGEGILRGIQDTIALAEAGDWRGLVIGNQAKNFSVGANLMLLAMFAFEEEWDDLEMAIRLFQETSMRCRYSSIPVVGATQGYVFGGGCEINMHCDAVCASAESYIGLVEAGVGLIPAGAGSKEMALRASDSFFEGDVQIPTLIEKFKNIATAAVGTSAVEAFELGYLLPSKDRVVMNTALAITEAKKEVIRLSEGYIEPLERQDVYVLGRQGLGALYTAANELRRGNWASDHDIKIARAIAYVLCGGDLSEPQKVPERYLLDLECEQFMKLMGEQKTAERLQYTLQHNRPLRN